MTWEVRAAATLEQWENSETGRFALEQKKKLLLQLTANSPRPRQKLLHICCGNGYFLEFFSQAGFDVTGLDSSPDMLRKAAKRLGARADLHVGRADHLIFDDSSYDFVLLTDIFEYCPKPEKVLLEAARVCRKGLLITFFSSLSLFYISTIAAGNHKNREASLGRIKWWNWPQMRRFLENNLGRRVMKARSVLIGPHWTWQNRSFFQKINTLFYPPYCGACCAVLIQMEGQRVKTPLAALAAEPHAT